MRDSRQFPRVPVHFVVRYRDGRELAEAFVQSLSGGGVFIRTSRPLPIGTEVTMEIVVEDASQAPVRVRGQVVWERLLGRAEAEDGMGVKFLDPPPEDLRKLLTTRAS